MSNEIGNNAAHGQKGGLKDCASEVFEESSVCAVSSILSTDNKGRKIFRSTVFVLFTVVFLCQCIAFLCYVFQYPTVVEYQLTHPEKVLAPAYTFCNFNTIKRSKFCAKHPDNCTTSDKELCEKYPRFCGTPDTQVPEEDAIDEVEDWNDLFELIHDASDMVNIDDDEEDIPAGPLPRSNRNEMGVAACYSYNEIIDSPLDPKYKKTSILGHGATEVYIFDPQENELLYPETEAGIMFSVHSPFEAVNPFETGFFMKPGYVYRITVKLTEEVLAYDCINYTELWLKNDKSGPRSQEMCKHKCLSDFLTGCFNCTEPMILYPNPSNHFCTPEDTRNASEECRRPENEIAACIKNCKDDCVKMKYSYEVQETFLNRYALYAEKNESRNIRVHVQFPETQLLRIIHKPQFQVLEIFSLIGGFLAFWIGLSMVQIVEVFHCMFLIRGYFFRNRSGKSGNTAA